jgi:hypothetical protein
VACFDSFPCHFVYYIWWDRNHIVFQDKQIHSGSGGILIEKLTNEYKCDPKQQKVRVLLMPLLDYETPWGFFDGASQGHPPRCGFRVLLFMNSRHFFYIRYVPGHGSNNK